ncbi:tyrosine--tRNA ligase, mitochondrial [Octopus sinensis]|uniref:Tyrosine--tRNA ligase n=1 Tax=Octopus sinensis TaxID=2607531 RepID=A0A6P7SS82_9MOLL|nr:tyrosine--tRNA ligase, mitochondrial [Octopus sinensis]
MGSTFTWKYLTWSRCIIHRRLRNFGKIQRCQSSTAITNKNILQLHERGLFQNVFPPESSPDLMKKLLSGPQCIYCGFDPTASSLHVGNLLAIIALLHSQRVGHQPIAVVGGCTAKIGDPSGRKTDRVPMDNELIEENSSSIKESLQRIFDNHRDFLWKQPNKELPEPLILNNEEWYANLNVIDFLAKYGRSFRLADMLSKHSVKSRLSSPEGMNFTEFTYQMFQSFDWLTLHKHYNCSIQIGGNDQLGNIVAGYEFISQMTDEKVLGLTIPLLTTTTGDKLGKSAGNTVWLNADKTSPFDLYQYFLNQPDADVERLLKLYTFLSNEHIENIMEEQRAKPHERIGQRTLAEQVVLLVHDESGLKMAKRWTEAFFTNNTDVLSRLSESEITELFRSAATCRMLLEPGMTVLETCMKANCFDREVDAERIIRAGGVRFNHQRVAEPDMVLQEGQHILSNKLSLIRVGKKNHYIVKWLP